MKFRYSGLLIAAIVFSVSACGLKGPLEPPQKTPTPVQDASVINKNSSVL